MNREQIQSTIAYYESDKIANLQKSIEFYKSVGARKDLTQMYSELADLQSTVDNLKGLLDNGPQKRDSIKVRVTEHNGNLVIETIDPDDFDQDFTPAGQGRIGCSLSNTSRLGVSEEALALMKTYKTVGDVIGDLMGESDSFTWIGGPYRVLQKDSVVCRYFKSPAGYTVIDNVTSEGLVQNIDHKAAGSVSVDYSEFEQELWIELSKAGSWKPKTDNPELSEYRYNDYYTLENWEGGRFVGGRVYDPQVVILNAPDGMVKTDSEGHRTVMMDKALEKEILDTCINIFKTGDERKVKAKDIMSYINPLFDLGFDNNVMNPRDGYWRMSIRATPQQILEKLRSFKRESISVSV